MLRLVTIPISHYCEKARWALDRARIPFREERHVQGIHRIAARRAGGGSTVPVLVTPDGAIGESQQILEWVDARLAPEQRLFPQSAAARAEVDPLCRRLDERLGPAARRLIYVHMFDQRALVLGFNNQGVPWWEDRALRYGWQPLRRFIERELGIVPGVQARDEAIVFEELDHVAALLADGRPFLCGERFGAADLTFAALSAAATLPEGYGVRVPQPEALAPATAALVQRARSHPAGQHALRLYAEQRRGAPAGQSTGTVAA
ncbi:MAG TPA: glutathione S-transferase family protein [Solirubrobacteraceae bacterium]